MDKANSSNNKKIVVEWWDIINGGNQVNIIIYSFIMLIKDN